MRQASTLLPSKQAKEAKVMEVTTRAEEDYSSLSYEDNLTQEPSYFL
jgi:hypothetical protein